ncbi:YqiA/YcfP family alpha/beta fold hydrolase [Candidatus Thiothrix sp. Deng01]|uniref:YqiA/YcfP family alpha/beta fold hydrolase n=1 Tax=Candidatus Thiothrix phosphatis TaxID=3112415 RepID=A0ABU6CVP7_9GAMM|nr:YqiA/YcfP family alpha/beta fold hydrolase [Candidatus Thiothrix sp. Deng01]MEB4590904.1 YqiA/YcfP family alpha/beta fold hydrolase [Candidatus Thiothrix sp. Deng01]
MIIYIHGFNSSSLSTKAQVLKQWLASRNRVQEWFSPDLPHRPAEAMATLIKLIEAAQEPPKLVGSSLGGFYATHLVAKFGLKAVLINPAVHPALLLRSLAGTTQQFWYGGGSYTFTQEHVNELEALDQLAPANPEKMLVMLENGDETLDWRDAAAYYRQSHQLIFQGGDHSFTRFQDILELIDRF